MASKNPELRVAVVGQRLRGHFSDLLANPPLGIRYVNPSSYAPTDVIRGRPAMSNQSWAARLVRTEFAIRLGIFAPVIREPKRADAVLSVNRFYVGRLPAAIWLERAAAPLHYEPRRLDNSGTRTIVRWLIERPRTAIVCWSDACRQEFMSTYGFYTGFVPQVIPPLVVPPATLVTDERSEQRQRVSHVDFLFIGAQFHAKGGKELILAFKRIAQDDGVGRLTVVSDPEAVGPEWLREIDQCRRVRLVPATLDRMSIWQLMDEHQVLVHPTLFEGYGLVILEALKLGLPIVATSVYAIPEMLGGGAGRLLTSYRRDYDQLGYNVARLKSDGRPLSDLVDELTEALRELLEERTRLHLTRMALARAERRFGSEGIRNDWSRVFRSLVSG